MEARTAASSSFDERRRPPRVLVDTIRGLVALHRAVPLGLLIGSVLVVEWLATGRALAVAADFLLCASFCLVIPASWRWLGSPRGDGRGRDLLGLAIYVLLCVAIVFGFGFAFPRAFGVITYVTDPSALGMLTVLLAVAGWGLGRDIDLEAGLEAERTRAERSALEAEHAQLLALRAQLDPHFLFNTLNAIAEWCREDPVVAETATLKLASILRTILEGIRDDGWPLEREIELLRELFEMYEVRDRERYRLHVDLPDPLPEILVPPLILLPAFENAITHGPGAGHKGEVRLGVREDADAVVVEVLNPGAFESRRDGGQGIATVERRLELAYGDDASFDIRAEGEGTVTTISFPRRNVRQGAP
jgi:two-component system sensor histidine kinase AlgZ